MIKGTPVKTGVLTPTTVAGIPSADLLSTDGVTKANALMFTVENQVVRYSLVGNPAAATHHVATAAAAPIFVFGETAIRSIKFINTAAGASTVRYTTFRVDE